MPSTILSIGWLTKLSLKELLRLPSQKKSEPGANVTPARLDRSSNFVVSKVLFEMTHTYMPPSGRVKRIELGKCASSVSIIASRRLRYSLLILVRWRR